MTTVTRWLMRDPKRALVFGTLYGMLLAVGLFIGVMLLSGLFLTLLLKL